MTTLKNFREKYTSLTHQLADSLPRMVVYGCTKYWKSLERDVVTRAIWVGGAKMNDLVEMGHYLGDLENELKGDNYIKKFVSLGCKTYAYVTEEGKSVIKAKGFSLKNIKVDFDDFDKIIEIERESQIQNNVPAEANVKTFEQFNIRREKNTQSLYNVTIQKDLQFTFDKRVLCFEDLTTRPYGY